MNNDIKESLLNISTDTGEVLIDTCLKEGILKDLPILNMFINLLKMPYAIKDVIFANKLFMFLNKERNLSDKEKKQIYKKIDSYHDKVSLGEEVVNIVDKAENSKKAGLVACAMKVLLRDDIDVNFYLRLINKISGCYYRDLLCVKDFKNEDSEYYNNNDVISGDSLDQLCFYGFLEETGYDMGSFSDDEKPNGKRYKLNKYGIMLRDILITNTFE